MRGRCLRFALALLATFSADPALAQAGPKPAATVVPRHLPHPLYPPIAQAARVQGDLQITVTVRHDGTVATAELTGPDSSSPIVSLLGPAALEAAKQARFDCRECDAGSAPTYSLVYSFRFADAADPSPEFKQPAPVVESSGRSRVTTLTPSLVIVCGLKAQVVTPARSIKCGWLWKCGSDTR